MAPTSSPIQIGPHSRPDEEVGLPGRDSGTGRPHTFRHNDIPIGKGSAVVGRT